MRIQKAVDNYLEYQEVIGNTVSTIRHNKVHLQIFINWSGNIEMKSFTYDTYKNYILFLRHKKNSKNNKPLASRTIFTYAECLKAFIHYCEENRIITNDVFSKIKLPKYQKKVIRILNENEIKAILGYFDINSFYGARNDLIISLMLDCGLRLSEVTNLKFTDFQKERNVILVNGKCQKQRFVPFSKNTQIYFDRYLSFFENKFVPTQQFFVDIVGFPITNDAIKSFFQRMRNTLKIRDLHPHLLRHTFATTFLLNGGDPIHLQIILGHSTLTMTKNYVHIAGQISIAEQMKFSPLANLI